MTDPRISRFTSAGLLRVVHRGVFSVFTGELSPHARIWAALAYAGDGAVVSHATAAWLEKFGDVPSVIEVSVPGGRHVARQAGLKIYRVRNLEDRRHPARVPPRTRVEDTVLDLIDQTGPFSDVAELVTRVVRERLTTPERLRARAAARSRLRHRPMLYHLLVDVSRGVHSLLERVFYRDVELSHGLAVANRQSTIKRRGRKQQRDAEYPFDVIVEVDGEVGHSKWSQRLRDMSRDNANVVDGGAPLRYGWPHATEQSCETAYEIATLLWRRGWTGELKRCGPRCCLPSLRETA